jgi:hypothetical protein
VKRFVPILFLLSSLLSFSQEKAPKVSNEKGSFYLSWGYNRSSYSKSDLQIVGDGYNLKFHGITASDRPHKFDFDTYFNPKSFTVPQFNVRAGYYFMDKYSVSVGYDHMKYVTNAPQSVSITGFVESDKGYNGLSGNYDHTPYSFEEDDLHYENSDGLNYFRFQVERTDQWYKTKKRGWFAFNTLYGIAGGFLLTFNDLNFGDLHTRKRISISGWGMSGMVGLRADFFNHLFIQADFIAGFHHLTHVKTRHDTDDYARQFYGFVSGNVSIGTIWYLGRNKKAKEKEK